jgi:DNA-binding PadR family transcriptional regulator
LCPVVLGLVASRPPEAGEVARELDRRQFTPGLSAGGAASIALRRLRLAGLIYATPTRRGRELYRVTQRGRRELSLQPELRASALQLLA